jgi:acetolactate synthase-1/2/3 large subunit
MILAGGGVIRAGAAEELREFARRLDAPVACTLMGLGAYPGNDPLYTGMIGMHGSRVSNLAAQSCDLLIAVGSRFSDRVTGPAKQFCGKAKIVHLDIDRAEVDKNICTDHHIIGDVRDLLTLLNRDLPQYSRDAWKEAVNKTGPNRRNHGGTLTPRAIVETVQAVLGEEAIVTTDVGQHQMWTAQYFKYTRPRQLITSGGFGTMGFGLGAAVGSALGNPTGRWSI